VLFSLSNYMLLALKTASTLTLLAAAVTLQVADRLMTAHSGFRTCHLEKNMIRVLRNHQRESHGKAAI
tara:strand:- start:214 stop:417 length:204 start_codon:yes stop_codon:yes gene_type:complete